MPADTNKPKRFNLIPRLILMPGAWEIGGDKVRKLTEVAMEYKEDEKGMYVLASECDNIVAENERLKSQVAGLQLVRGYEHYVADLVQRLADQNERLRKAVEASLEHFESGFTSEYRVVEACKAALHGGSTNPPDPA